MTIAHFRYNLGRESNLNGLNRPGTYPAMTWTSWPGTYGMTTVEMALKEILE
jgi:hypothetical protein